jgi:aryl-alcohol dehydrogenase-like predicted oxidoreductase
MVSSLGVGTYLGPETDAADNEYVEAMTKALSVGINVLDTYVTYKTAVDSSHVLRVFSF